MPANQRTDADVAFANAHAAKKRAPQEKAQSDADKANAEAENDTDGFAESASDNPARRQFIRNALNGLVSSNGKTSYRKALVREAVADGATVEEKEGQRALVGQGGSYRLQSQLTKTAIDYAEHLIARRNEMSAGNVGETLPNSETLVRIRTVYGDQVRVRKSDLDGTRTLIPTFSASG